MMRLLLSTWLRRFETLDRSRIWVLIRKDVTLSARNSARMSNVSILAIKLNTGKDFRKRKDTPHLRV